MIRRKSTKKIILHCSATREGQDIRANTIRQWHKQRGFEDIGYHYVIDLDGKVEKGRDEKMVGAHCVGQNSDSIGICYIGGCDKSMQPKNTLTEAQKHTLLNLVYLLLENYHLTIKDVYTHNLFSSKACPSFSINWFRNEYEKAFNM